MLTAYAFRPGADGFNVAEGIAAVLTLPMIVPALPIIYVVGGLAWAVADSESGDPTLLVTLTFTVLMTGVALANVWLLSVTGRFIRATRSRSGPKALPDRRSRSPRRAHRTR